MGRKDLPPWGKLPGEYAPPAWQGSDAAMAALEYVDACATLFDALDGAVAALVARGYDEPSSRAVVAWNYVAGTRAGMGLTS